VASPPAAAAPAFGIGGVGGLGDDARVGTGGGDDGGIIRTPAGNGGAGTDGAAGGAGGPGGPGNAGSNSEATAALPPREAAPAVMAPWGNDGSPGL
jgi:hypothetical protein